MCSIWLQMSQSFAETWYTTDVDSVSHEYLKDGETRVKTLHTAGTWIFVRTAAFIYHITRGICSDNKRASPQAFWLWCFKLPPPAQGQLCPSAFSSNTYSVAQVAQSGNTTSFGITDGGGKMVLAIAAFQIRLGNNNGYDGCQERYLKAPWNRFL